MTKIFKNSLAPVALLAAVVSSISVPAQNLNSGEYLTTEEGVAYRKAASLKNGSSTEYVIDLETFVLGERKIQYENRPADIVMVLDLSGSMGEAYNGTTRIAALKEAVRAFINSIDDNDLNDENGNRRPGGRLGNRIAIVPYSRGLLSGEYFYTFYTMDEKESLLSAVNALGEDSSTYTHKGMEKAYELMNGLDDSHQLRTTVLFTDGVPGWHAFWWDITKHTEQDNSRDYTAYQIAMNAGDADSRATANATINWANKIKGLANPDKYITSKVYAVGLLDYGAMWGHDDWRGSNYHYDIAGAISDVTGEPIVGHYRDCFADQAALKAQIDLFLEKVSSDYETDESTTIDNGGRRVDDKYFSNAADGDMDLRSIFEAIATGAAGGTFNEELTESVTTVDVVSSSFTAPNNASSVSVFVAPCIGREGEYLTFGDEGTAESYGLPAITVNTDPETNSVSTKGFDFSLNWCGPDETNTSSVQTGFHGFKQILRFTITVNEDAVGGPHVVTNDEDSGIYKLDENGNRVGDPILRFNRPYVKLPVSIWIQKEGLVDDDSAVFTLYSSPAKEFNSDDYEENVWTSFTKIMVNSKNMVTVTNENGDQVKVAKITGLDPDYYYKIKEDAWAFGYQYQNDGIVYTVGDNIKNPFVINNTPKDIVKDEAVYRNVFNPASTSGTRSN